MGRHSNDHEIKIGSTTKGLKLIRNDDGSAMYQVIEEQPNYQPSLRYTYNNWIGGHGQHTRTQGDIYMDGQSIDTTQDGRVILGPLIHEVQEDDDSVLDSAPVDFVYFPATSEWLMATSGKIYRYVADDTGIDTDEALDATETGVDCDADASTPIPVNSIIYIESEKMLVTATGTSLTVIRGYLGSTAATHSTNTDVYIYKWKAATTTVANVTQLCVFGVTVFAACGASTAYKYSTDGVTWTTSTLTDPNANAFLVSPNPAGTADVLWKFKTPNEVKSNSNGTNAGTPEQWGSANYIGEASTNITNMFVVNDKHLVGREDNLFYFDSDGGIHPMMSDLKHNRSTNNFKYVTEWQAATYFSIGKGVGEITSYNAYEPMGPLTGIEDIGKDGVCIGLSSDKDWLYAGYDEGTNNIIYKCREVRVTGQAREAGLRWEYCPWVFLGTNACSVVKVCQHSPTDRRLWFGYGTKTGFVILSDSPTDDTSALFCASGYLRMSYDYGSDPNWDKLWQSAVIETTGGATGETVQIKYRKDAETSATECIAAETTNGVHETNFGSALSGKRIQYEIHLTSNTPSATPEVSLFQAKGVEKPTTIRIHEATYAIGSEPMKSAETIRTFLRGGRTSTTLISFADLRYGETTGGTAGTDYAYCVMEPGYPREIEVIHTKRDKPELGIEVRLREVSFS